MESKEESYNTPKIEPEAPKKDNEITKNKEDQPTNLNTNIIAEQELKKQCLADKNKKTENSDDEEEEVPMPKRQSRSKSSRYDENQEKEKENSSSDDDEEENSINNSIYGIHSNEKECVESYLRYYSKLSNQHNVLLDTNRAHIYSDAIMSNQFNFYIEKILKAKLY